MTDIATILANPTVQADLTKLATDILAAGATPVPTPTPTPSVLAITSINPPSATPGTPVTIVGTGFGTIPGALSIGIYGITVASLLVSWADTQIVFNVPDYLPPGAAGDIVVKLPNGSSVASSQLFTLTSGPPVTPPPPTPPPNAPTVSGIAPTSGDPGSTVTISGTNFGTTPGSVAFGATMMAVTSWSDTSIVATVPVGAQGGGVIAVKTAAGVTVDSSQTFTVNSVAPTPTPTPTPVPPPAAGHPPAPVATSNPGSPIVVPFQSVNVIFKTVAGFSLQMTDPVLTNVSTVVYNSINPDAHDPPYQYYGDAISDDQMFITAAADVPFAAVAKGYKNVAVYAHGKQIFTQVPDASGNVAGVLNFSKELNGPLVLDVYAWDSAPGTSSADGFQGKQRVMLYIEGGTDYVAPVPAAAKGMNVVFEDDFTSALSVSSTDPNAKWYPSKPDGAGQSDFGDAIFQDPDNLRGGKNPFHQVGSFLRLRCQYDPGVTDPFGYKRVWTTGQIASGKPGGKGGFYVKLPYYAECRFQAVIGGVPWPAFWNLTKQGLVTVNAGNIETDTVELIGLFPTMFRSGGILYNPNFNARAGAEPGLYPHDGGCFDFHTYGVLVTDTTTTFYMDGVESGSFPTDPLPAGLTGPREDFVMIDNAFGGGGWDIWNSELPNSAWYDMWVDFVKVWS